MVRTEDVLQSLFRTQLVPYPIALESNSSQLVVIAYYNSTKLLLIGQYVYSLIVRYQLCCIHLAD